MPTPDADIRRRTVALAASPIVGPRLGDRRMAILVDRAGEHILWANPSAERALELGPNDGAAAPRARALLAAVGRPLSAAAELPSGITRLRVFADFRATPHDCLFEAVQLPDGSKAVLVTVVAPVPVPTLDETAYYGALCRSLAAGDGYAAVLAEDGRVVAEAGTPPGHDVRPGVDGLHVTPIGGTLYRLAVGGALLAAKEPPPAASAPSATAVVPDAAPPPRRAAIPGSRRFSWQSDAEDRVTFVSPELSLAVGARGADVIGRTWREIAAERRLDPTGRLAASLAGRATWSGQTVLWPSEDGRRVPIDLAGLSVADDDGRFVGFRGFGQIRLGDAIEPAPEPTPAADAAPEPVLPSARVDPEPAPAPPRLEPPPTEVAEAPRATTVEAPTPVAAEAAVAAPELVPIEAAAAPSAIPAPPDTGEAATVSEPAPMPTPADAPSGTVEPAMATEAAIEATSPAAPLAVARPEVQDFAATPPEPKVEATAPPTEPSAPSAPPPVAAEATRAAPVDGGRSLSRPEWEAFRQVASALGARFEGDHDPAAANPVAPAAPAGPATTADDRALSEARQLIDRIPSALLVCRGETVLHLNPAALSLLGYADRAAFEAAGGLASVFAEPTAAGVRRVLAQRADGTTLPVEARLQAVPWNGGSALLVALSRLDHPAAADGGDPTAPLLDVLPDGVLLVDRAGRVVAANRAAERLLGRPRIEIIGRLLVHLVTAESRLATGAALAEVVAPGFDPERTVEAELTALSASEATVPLAVGFGRIGNDADPAACLVLRDLSRWRRAEDDLRLAAQSAERANARKSDVLARVSHEIRTPINAVIGFSEVMLEERFGPIGEPRYRDYLRDIRSSGLHMLSLVDDLLDLAKIESGNTELAFEPVALNDVVREGVALMQPQAGAERVILRTSLAPDLPALLADRRSLHQIVLNLLSNAVKYNTVGGQVIVSTGLDEFGAVTLRVRDTGIGMAPGDIDTALEPFGRVPGSHHDGTGLGLPLTKALAEANDATFTIESALDQGTLVEITFPAARTLAA